MPETQLPTDVEQVIVEKEIGDWLEKVVIGLNLCPFAKRPFDEKRIRIRVDACKQESLAFESIVHELQILDETDVKSLETTVLVLPKLFSDFEDYNDFLFAANELIVLKGWEGTYQIASFHPEYQFAGTDKSDAENFTNRAPYPVFHLIREASLSAAIANYPDVSAIPERNIALMNDFSEADLKHYFSWCFKV